MATTYTATILDPHHPGGRDTYPGIMYTDGGDPIHTIRIRYANSGGASRVSNYVHAGPASGADHHNYAWDSDGDWDSAAADETDWVIELHPDDD